MDKLVFLIVYFILTPVLAQDPSFAASWTGSCDNDSSKNELLAQISNYIRDTVNPNLNNRLGPPGNCGGDGWALIANIDMNNTAQTCPGDWELITSGSFRGCGNPKPGDCHSANFTTEVPYSQICGRIIAVQFGDPNAFFTFFNNHKGLEKDYLDGVSLTHGNPGFRKHIWSFAVTASAVQGSEKSTCQCINSTAPWPLTIPAFIGDHYYCDTGTTGSEEAKRKYYTDNPVWDGQGCSPISTCCQVNNPPWFRVNLPTPTTDNVEARICTNAETDEDVVVTRVELYIK